MMKENDSDEDEDYFEISAAQWRAARAATGLTMRELAALAETSTDSLVNLEQGIGVHERITDSVEAVFEDYGVEIVEEGVWIVTGNEDPD